jgi:hypothetical protein
MDLWYPVVIGSVMFFYINFFNKNAKMYLESGRTLSWDEFVEKTFKWNDNRI